MTSSDAKKKEPIYERQSSRAASFQGVMAREMFAANMAGQSGNYGFMKRMYSRNQLLNWVAPLDLYLQRVFLPHDVYGEYLIPRSAMRTDKVVLHIHGGGYVIGYLPIYQACSVKLAQENGYVPVFSIDYRVAPKDPYPAALDDLVHAIDWLEKNKGIAPSSVIALGDSAGGGLALALAMRLRDEGRGKLAGLVLISPWADLTNSGRSHHTRFGADPLFGRVPHDARYDSFSGRFPYAGDHNLNEPYLSPLFGDFTDLPPMMIHVGECEMLYDDAKGVYKKAIDAGVPATFKEWQGMFHTFQMFFATLPEADRIWQQIGAHVRECFAFPDE